MFLKSSKIHRKTPVFESLFNKVAGLNPCNFIKKRLQHRCFSVNFANFVYPFYRTPPDDCFGMNFAGLMRHWITINFFETSLTSLCIKGEWAKLKNFILYFVWLRIIRTFQKTNGIISYYLHHVVLPQKTSKLINRISWGLIYSPKIWPTSML